MTRTIEAFYENGILRPLEPLEGVAEHSRLTITLELGEARPHPLAGLIGTLPNEDAREMIQAIEEEFEQIDVAAGSPTAALQRRAKLAREPA